MLRTELTPIRHRTILEDVYAEAGMENFQFAIPQPFTADLLTGVVEIGATPQGVANQLNQVLAENLGNNISSKIKAAVKNGTPLPTQECMDELYDNYDFSGTRTGGNNSTSLLDRIFARLASQFIRKLIKKKGYKDMPAPVFVAKRGEEPAEGQISFEDFEVEVFRLINNNGPWAEVKAFVEVRDELIEEARIEEAAVREREQVAENKLAAIGL
jgi:hypothetical protein